MYFSTIYLLLKDRGLGVSNSILFHRMFLENAQVFYIQRGIAYENCCSGNIRNQVCPTGPFGNKALGEPPAIPPAPAIRNAFLHATGIPVNEIPLSPQRVFEA